MPVRHVAEQGDSLARLALHYGLAPDSIAAHPDNAELVAERGDLNVLAPGDVVVIPDREAAEYECVTDKRHVFRRRGVPMKFRVELLDRDLPRKHVAYELVVDGSRYEGVTDEHGRIEQWLPNSARRGRLIVDGGAVDVTLDFGHMDPVDTPSGLQKRLINLGYTIHERPDEIGDATRSALRAFQGLLGLEPTGEADARTLAELARCHDEPGAYREVIEAAIARGEQG